MLRIDPSPPRTHSSQNAARHAEASRIEVSLAREGAIVELRIADDGRGFDPAVARERGGLGLISIDERVRVVAGQTLITSEPERGTVITVRVRLQPDATMPKASGVSLPRVLLADDYELIARSLVRVLCNDFEIVATVGDGRALVDAARQLQPDVIVSDISMPLLNGPEALGELRRGGLGVPVIFLTAHPDAALAAAMIRAGAAGFVLKHSSRDELVTAIREVLRGRVYVSPLISEP